MAILKDSGERREFDSGAVRDMSIGKGRMDLLPLHETFQFLRGCDIHDKVIWQMMAFVDGRAKDMIPALVAFVEDTGVDPYEALLNISIHFEDGALKYDDNNWKKGIPVNVYVDSALRHYVKHKMGMRDEPHDRAFMWNVLCGTWTINNMPELNPYKELREYPQNPELMEVRE